jgi:hypothetical protein
MALPDLAKFAVVVAAIFGVPRLAAGLRLPPMVGLLLFGVALGPHVLGFFGEDRPIANFFAELGKPFAASDLLAAIRCWPAGRDDWFEDVSRRPTCMNGSLQSPTARC